MPFPRGAKPSSRWAIAQAMPYRPVLAAPTTFGVLPKQLQTWGNDRFGDCVTAEECASKLMFSIMRQAEPLLIPNATCIAWARSHGYLNGASLTDVMDDMIKDGIVVNGQTYKDGPYKTVDWTKYDVLANAIYFGPVKIAISANEIENAGAGQRMGWVLSGAGRDRNTDHSVALWGFGTAQELADQMHNELGIGVSLGRLAPGTPSNYLYSWKTVGIVEHQSMVNITDEAFLRTPTTLPDPNPQPPQPPPGPTPGPVTGDYIFIDPATKTYSFPSDWTVIPSR